MKCFLFHSATTKWDKILNTAQSKVQFQLVQWTKSAWHIFFEVLKSLQFFHVLTHLWRHAKITEKVTKNSLERLYKKSRIRVNKDYKLNPPMLQISQTTCWRIWAGLFPHSQQRLLLSRSWSLFPSWKRHSYIFVRRGEMNLKTGTGIK